MADDAGGDRGVADAVWAAEPPRGGSLESDVGLRRPGGGAGGGGARGGYAEDPDQAGYAAKTDCLDAQRLADALRRDSVVGIYYPPPAIRDLRELCRYRCHLARLQASLKQRIHAVPLRQGLVEPGPLWGRRGTAWLDALPLEGWAGASLTGLRQVLADVRGQLVPVLGTLRQLATTDAVARALDTRPGFGPVFSVTLRAEIGTITRFPDGPHLASYAGLVPRVERSAGRHWTGRITKAGSPWLRWVLIEAAIHQFRRQDAFGRWAGRWPAARAS